MAETGGPERSWQAISPGLLKMKAEAVIKESYTRYILRADDFKFITPPKAAKAPSPPPVTIDSLLAESFLGHTSA